MARKAKRKAKRALVRAAKAYKLLGTSWHVQTKVFFEHSTLHGVRYIAEVGRPFVEKFMWFACVAVGAVATVVIIVSLWEKFQTNPTITGLDTDFHNWDVPFPAITVCQEMPSNASRILEYIATNIPSANEEAALRLLEQLTKLSYNNILSFKNMPEIEIIPEDTDLKDLVFQLMNKCEDIFDVCTWKSEKFNCCDGFFPVFTESGFCYAFNSRHYERIVPGHEEELPEFNMQYIKETDINWALDFAVKDNSMKMPVYILNSDEQAGVDIRPQHVWDYKIGSIFFSVKQTYTTEDTRQLSIKQRRCVFPDEIPLDVDHIYTYTACTRQCRMDNAMEVCNCVPHFYPQTTGRYRHCRLHELQCLAKNYKTIVAAERCACQLGCQNTVYEVEKLTEKTEGLTEPANSLSTFFSSWPMIRYKREVLFGWVDLLVSFGGIAGLFLGFSLLSGVEILYYFTIRVCCMVVRERPELERIEYEESVRPPPDYDLSLVPSFIDRPYPGNGLQEVAKGYFQDGQNHNKIKPTNKLAAGDCILPPFGIEFIN